MSGNDYSRFFNSEPYIMAGFGKTSYKMSRGAFKIKDKIEFACPIWVKKIESINNRKIIFLADEKERIGIEIGLEQIENRIYLSFKKVCGDINRVWINLAGFEDEFLYGCGEHFTEFNLKGQKVRIWVAEHQNLKRILGKVIKKKLLGCKFEKPSTFRSYETYYVQPTFVSSKKYFVHVDASYGMEFDFSKPDRNELFIRGIPERVVIGYENDFEKLLENMTSFLGRQPRLPEWIFNGFIPGIQGGREKVLDKLDKMLKADARINAVWCQDWEGVRITSFGKQLMWNWEWDNSLYNDLPGLISELKKRSIGFMGYINPFLAVEGKLYRHASGRGYTVKDINKRDYLVKITTFPAAMIDLTNPEACGWIKDVIKSNMIDIGMCGWMADFGEYLPTDAVLFSGESAEEVHNLWPAMWAKVNHEAIQESGKADEIVFFTRAGYYGTNRYSKLMWNGDQHVDWSIDDGIASVIPATLSLSMSGIGCCHSDLGGYTTFNGIHRSRELLLRWAELSAFSPVMRSHEGNRPDDNIQFDFDNDTIGRISDMSRLHEGLKPYLMSLADEYETKGLPMIRPLFMYYDEKRAYTEKYEYLLGRDILVSPVIQEGVENKEVYLPGDDWVHLWTGKQYSGGIFKVQCPLGCPPVFYRKNSNIFSIDDLKINCYYSKAGRNYKYYE